jgi:hypothetical protein
MEQEEDIVTATDPTQSATAELTMATTESEPMQALTSDSTQAQAENVPTDRSDTDNEFHGWSAADNDKCMEEQIPKLVGKNQTRRRRSQLDDFITGAPSLPQGNRTCSAVDYTPTLDKEETKNPAKEIWTLLGARHKQ